MIYLLYVDDHSYLSGYYDPQPARSRCPFREAEIRTRLSTDGTDYGLNDLDPRSSARTIPLSLGENRNPNISLIGQITI